MKTRRVGIASVASAAVVVALIVSASYSWWDTQIMYLQEAPRVAHIEAQDAQLTGAAEIVDDEPLFGPPAGGGKAVVLKPGDGTIAWSVDLGLSTYRLFAIARVPDAIPWQNPTPEWPIFARLRVVGPDGAEVGDWTMPINYLNTYYDTARISFPAHHEGRYALEFSITGASEADLVVDRLDLRDELGNTLKAGFKDGRYLHTDEEIARLRENFRSELMRIGGVKTDEDFRALLADPQRRQALINGFNQHSGYRFNRYGQALQRAIDNNAGGTIPVGAEPKPDADAFQRHTETFLREWGEDYGKWNTRFDGRDILGAHGGAFLPHVAGDYLTTGDPEIALMIARTLIGVADLYPALDWSAQKFEPGELGSGHSRGIRFTFTAGRFGKIQYSGWEVGYPESLARMYDAVFPFIEEHGDELAAMARARIPWIENKDDLIAFLDTRLLQYVGDCVNRNRIRAAQGGSENMILHAIGAQGPNPGGELMARWLFTRTYWDMTNDGGIQDQAITGRLRDGSNTIGSVGYAEAAGTVLVSAAEMMSRYIDAGGSREYDLSDVNRFPAVLAGAFFPLESRVAGGYQPLIGDWGRSMNARIHHTIGTFANSFRFAFRNTRDPRMAWLMKNVVGRTVETNEEWALIEQLAEGQRDPQMSSVSRNLEGFGLAILEAGVDRDDFTRKRALTFRHGVGVGHAHADALTLEYYAHGVRALPGAGNRGGRPHPGHMNTKPGVTVDGADMRNSTAVNIGGTGWTTSFLPEPGAQYVSGAARFEVAPRVERYERQTAMIDIEGLDAGYVFDVLRVAGGREHIWSMHGPAAGPDDHPDYNFDLRQPNHPEAGRILAGFINPQQGEAGEVVLADWPMGREYEQRMLGGAFDETLSPVVTRSILMGHAGAELFTGQSDPDARGLEGSQWMTTIRFIQARREGNGLQTVWPHLIESYRGEPRIAQADMPAVTPADDSASAPVAMSILTNNGQSDLIIADGEGNRTVSAGGATMNGRFGYISRDGQGLRLAHLAGGTRLEHDGLTIETEAAEYEAQIVEVDYLNRRIRLDRPLPAAAPDEIELLIGAPDRPQGWKTESVDGDTITLAYSPALYQSGILSVDENEGSVVCSMNPNLLMADPRYYDNVVATDESGENVWRVRTMTPKYIFMYMQEPILDWQEIYTLDDFPDANGDGRRTVTITNWGEGDPRRDLTVEVAFVDVERQVVYFHLPEDEDVVAASGWAWAGSRLAAPEQNRWMINEAGKRWISNYTGKSNAIMLEGEARDDMFTDATGDGRRVLRMYHFGVGDSVRMTSNVVIRRVEDGVYDMKSSTPARAALPDGTELEIR